MIEVKGLTKRYGPHRAVADASFTVNSGGIVGFLGPNGAGKSTTMNVITGYISASSGMVLIDGDNILEYPERCKGKIGYLPENPPLYDDMTVDEYLQLVSQLKKVPSARIRDQLHTIVERTGLGDVRRRLVGNLSKGYRQRVGIAQALVGEPEILILDEPTSGLDPHQIIEIRDLIRSLRQEHTIVLSSHILPEVSAVCDRFIIIFDGTIVADGSAESLAESYARTPTIVLRVATGKEGALEALEPVAPQADIEVVPSEEPESTQLRISSKEGADLRSDLFFALAEAGVPILALRTDNLTLEDIFLRATVGNGEGA